MAHQNATGDSILDLLVLWRGAPGWFIGHGGARGGVAGGSTGPDGVEVLTSRIHYGEVDLELVFDPQARIVQLEGRSIPLGDANVLLIDEVDGPHGPAFAGARRVEPTIPESGRRIDLVLRRSTELLEYLRCDARLGDQAAQEQMEFLCAQIMGRCDARLANPRLQVMLDASCRR
jgi:hypothetical protein